MNAWQRARHGWHRWSLGLAWLVLSLAAAAAPDGGPAKALQELHRKLAGPLERSSLRRPVQLDSTETAGGLQGDVYAVVDHPLGEVRGALGNPAQWCEMLLLHINNRRCRTAHGPDGDLLTLSVVRRYDKPVEQAFELPFVYRVAENADDYLSVDLSADSGPLGTSRYRVVLEAVAVDERRTFLHFRYAYDHNLMARIATVAYLATFGSHKVGFTETGKGTGGEPDYIRGPRGLVERNAMRYFLTLDAYLDGVGTPAPERFERRLRGWFESVEQYPRQLHEVDFATYLALKREDRQREASAKR